MENGHSYPDCAWCGDEIVEENHAVLYDAENSIPTTPIPHHWICAYTQLEKAYDERGRTITRLQAQLAETN